MRKIAVLMLCITVLCIGALSGCSASSGLVTDYIMALDGMDFAKAYESLYVFNSSSLTLDEYTAAYKQLTNALKITDISIPEYSIGTDENGDFVTYTSVYTSDYRDEPFTFEYTARIVSVGGNTGIEHGPHLILPSMQSGDRISVNAIDGKRGEIFTADGETLAENSYADTVYLYVPEVESINTTLSELSELIEFDAAKVKKSYETAVANDYGTVIVKAFMRGSVSDGDKEKLLDIKGVRFDNERLTPVRYYPYEDMTFHLTGYLSSPSEEKLKELTAQGYPADIKVGAYALEQTYEDMLRGQDGLAVQIIDANGSLRETVYEETVSPGRDLRTSIDSKLQQSAWYALTGELLPGQAGCVVIMDADTGFINALTSYPALDTNLFSFPIPSDLWNELTGEGTGNPLYSRATSGRYPPGSSIKPFTVVPALESGAVDPDAEFPYTITNNEWIPPGETWIWPPVRRDEATRGTLNLVSAMRSSDNIYFAWTAMRAGEERFMEYMRRIGFEEAFPFDIPLSSANLINDGTEMTVKLLTDMGFGQGEMLITPVQLASLYTAFLNDGDVLAPQLVTEICETKGTDYSVVESREPNVLKESIMEPYTIRTLEPALLEVVKSGTAYALRSSKYTVAAKTGTPKIGGEGNKKEINWVVAYWPNIDDSKIVLVMVESEEDEGGQVKLNIARQLTDPELYGIDTSGEGD